MQKLNENIVGVNCIHPNYKGKTKNKERGITLIALIITIIVMLVLVGVTINVALTGGLFEKGEKAAYQTNAATIKEKLALKKAEELADNNGRSKDDYGITFADLELTGNLEDFKTQLTISKDGTLYYIEDAVNEKEKAWLEEIGITAGSGQNRRPLTQIKNGDVWNNVTFYSTEMSSEGITIPTTGIKAIKDENGNYVPEIGEDGNYIETNYSNTDTGIFNIYIGDYQLIFMTTDGTRELERIMMLDMQQPMAYCVAFSSSPEWYNNPIINGKLYSGVSESTVEAVTSEKLEQISFSGEVVGVYSYTEGGDVIDSIIQIPQEIKNWFSGDVTYVESDSYFE